jgi:hypothetical protein
MPGSQKPTRISSKQSPSIPETEQPIRNAADLKSYVRKILLASPEFPRIYATVAASQGANPKQARDLAERIQKIQIKEIRGTMSTSNVRSCTHIKVDGVRCGSPALRGEQFCYFHQRMVRGVRTPPNARLHPIAMIESPEAIQAALMEVINALARNQIDLKRAELILRALNIAARNARNVHFGLHDREMIKQIPEYEDAHVGTEHVGTAAPGCASGPDVPGRSNSPTNRCELDLPATAAEPFARPPRELSRNEFWKREAEDSKRRAAEIRAAHPGPDPLSPKPPVGVKTTPVPKQRKTNGASPA